jgi:hypothetical protein
MLWITAQTFVTIAITVAFAKIVKASLRTSIGLGIFYSGYEMALVGVITGHIESCHVGMFGVLCGTILFLAKLLFSLANHAPVSLPAGQIPLLRLPAVGDCTARDCQLRFVKEKTGWTVRSAT